jgi:hypothetical protein
LASAPPHVRCDLAIARPASTFCGSTHVARPTSPSAPARSTARCCRVEPFLRAALIEGGSK